MSFLMNGYPSDVLLDHSSVVIDHLQHDRSNAVVFIYFDYKSKYTIIDVIGALLKQVARYRLTTSNAEALTRHAQRGTRPVIRELLKMLQSEMETYCRRFIVVDALDECPAMIRHELLGILQKLSEDGNIKLMVTSRDLSEFAIELARDARQEITADQQDMEMYINVRISHSFWLSRHVAKEPSLRKEIIDRVISKSQGM